ncbi:hypothetical protein ES703_39535 [subsurface metagenome]
MGDLNSHKISIRINRFCQNPFYLGRGNHCFVSQKGCCRISYCSLMSYHRDSVSHPEGKAATPNPTGADPTIPLDQNIIIKIRSHKIQTKSYDCAVPFPQPDSYIPTIVDYNFSSLSLKQVISYHIRCGSSYSR